MKFSENTDHKYPTVVRHQGVAIAMALCAEGSPDKKVNNIYYRVLAPDPTQPDDDKNWSDRRKLAFPEQLRPAGMGLVTVDLKTAERSADAPFQAVSDGKHVYLFRQATDGTLYVDRFVFDPAQQTLNPNWEARFQRSRKRDVPASRKDSLGARDMEGEPFLEPTTELATVEPLEQGRFCVLLLPGRLPTEWRWQILATNAAGEIDSFSIRRGEDGLFDVTDVGRTCLRWADSARRFLTGPAALLYMQQEEGQDEYGRPRRLKRGARVMLAAPVGSARYALELDGVDDYVEIPSESRLNLGEQFTIEAWVKPADDCAVPQDGHVDIISRWEAEGSENAYLLGLDGQGHLLLWTHDGTASSKLTSEGTIPADSWSHVAGVLKGGTLKVYIDGVPDNSSVPDAVAPRPSNQPLRFGADPIGRTYFKGQINNVRLWNKARSEEDIREGMHRSLAGDEPGLAGYWPLDEGSGYTIHDQASENHGKLHLRYALEFDGLDDYVEVPEIEVDFSNGLTVEAWVYYRSFNSWSRIIDFGNGRGQDNIHFGNKGKNNVLCLGVFQGNSHSVLETPTLETDQWLHLAATVDENGNGKLYKNGVAVDGGKVHVPKFISRGKNYIGRSNWEWDKYFDGFIHDVRVWNVARSEEDIREDKDRRLTGNEGNLVGYWPFDEGSGTTLNDKAEKNHGRLHVGTGDNPVRKWPEDKSVAPASMAVLDFGVSRQGTLARMGDAPALGPRIGDVPALELDGVDDLITFEDEVVLGAEYTVEGWFKSSHASHQTILGAVKDKDQGNHYLLIELQQHGRLRYLHRVPAGTSGGENIRSKKGVCYADGQWHHFAAVKDDRSLTLYLDGDQAGQVSGGAALPDKTGMVMVMSRLSAKQSKRHFKGAIGDVRLWNVARTQDEIQQDMDGPPAGDKAGLVGYWPLNEGSGTILYDKAGENHGQLQVGSGDQADDKWAATGGPVSSTLVLHVGDGGDGSLAHGGEGEATHLSVPLLKSATGTAEPMDMLTCAVDNKGLTVCAGLLDLVRSGETPFLLEGADGLLHLYFRGNYGEFLVAQYDTLTARAGYVLPLGPAGDGPRLQFTARQPGTHMNGYQITVGGSHDETCQVTIDSQKGLKETWQNVPRELEAFLAVLNGTATSDRADPRVEEGKQVYYDYTSQENVQREGVPDLASGDAPFFGSALFAVGADNVPSDVLGVRVEPNGSAKLATNDNGRDCRWIPEPQGQALQFHGEADYVKLPPHRLDVTGDLTLEAWVQVKSPASGPMRIIDCQREDLRFALGLIKYKNENGSRYRVFAGSGDKAIETDDAHVSVSDHEWTHLAAVYDATNALKLDGQGYVDCGKDSTLDIAKTLTVEAWVTPDKIDSKNQVILSKWGSAPAEQSWRLYIDTQGKPCFETRAQDNKQVIVTADRPLVKGQSYHLAGIFAGAQEKVYALALERVGDCVEIKNGPELKDASFSVAFWAKRASSNGSHCVVWQGSSEKNKGLHIGFRETDQFTQFTFDFYFNELNADATYTDEEWHHWACTYDKSTKGRTIYRDGVQVAQDAEVEPYEGSGPLTIGRRPENVWPFKGFINNVRIWKSALTIENILEDMDKPADEVEWEEVVNFAFDRRDSMVAQGKKTVNDRNNSSIEGNLSGSSHIVESDPRSYQKLVVHPAGSAQLKSWKKDADKALLVTPTARVNIGRSAAEAGYFRGTIDEVRLWQVGRHDGQIQYYRDHPLPADPEDLVGHWRFEEGAGKTALDEKGSNHGRLVHPDAEKVANMRTPSALNARLTLYVNGREVSSSDCDGVAYGDPQFCLGAMLSNEDIQQPMAGIIDEVRVWNRVRTWEQIRDNMYRSLFGTEEGLVGYWPLNELSEEGKVIDISGHGQDGTLNGPTLTESTPPIGNEGPEVRNVHGGRPKPGFNRRIAGLPAAVEYGDMQWDAEGNLFGVMKRCYLFQEGAIQLIPGFKVGDLELNFVGQVQTAPTLIGYIEGAPPVPSENLTVNDPQEDDYVGTSSLELTEARETTQVYSASRDHGFDMSVDLKRGLAWSASVSSGFGVESEIFSTEGKVGLHAYFEHSLGQLSSASKTVGISKTMTKSLVLGGGWEETPYLDRDRVGQRYLPNNMGYALVKSATADLFALRLKRTGSLVAYQILPNPDIPEDWNIIMFPLNPRYVKNGTLDGMVGLVADPDYPGAIAGERGSYFKPLEAYALKEQIEQQAKQIEGYYASFGVVAKASTGAGKGGLSGELPEGELGYDWDAGRDRRSMANTYVWTADGGFYAEEEQFSSIRQESLGGSYHFLGQAGAYAEVEFPGFFFEVDALFGSHLDVTLSKSKEERRAFGLHVDVEGEGYLNEWNRQAKKYLAKPCPGKVDGYRFMTFYLQPKPDNFDRFFEQVVDPEWLAGQGRYSGDYSPNARALREARSRPNEVWRVLHRVTYVSRVPAQFGSPPEEVVPKDVRRPANLEANMGLIQEIKWLVPPQPSLIALGDAVNELLGQPPVNGDDGWLSGKIEEIIPWWTGVEPEAKKEIRRDVIEYLKEYYEIDLALSTGSRETGPGATQSSQPPASRSNGPEPDRPSTDQPKTEQPASGQPEHKQPEK